MFTGLIEEKGKILSVTQKNDSSLITIEATLSENLALGDSVAINGACQTVIKFDGKSFTVQAVEETLRLTTLGGLKKGDIVNLETAMTPIKSFGGHMVQGHVDCTGTIKQIKPLKSSRIFTIEFHPDYSKFTLVKGSICIDGISLTITAVNANTLDISVIPHSLENTTLAISKTGDMVNLEFDIIGKYLYNFINIDNTKEKSSIDMNFLRERGFA